MHPTKHEPTIFIIDFDDTLVTKSTPRTLIDPKTPNILEELVKNNVLLSIASRNSPFIVIRSLQSFNLLNFFTKIIADFRPKKYQVKHVWYELSTKYGVPIKRIIFLDDFADNCLNVQQLSKHFAAKGIQLFSILFDPRKSVTLRTIADAIVKRDFVAIKKISEDHVQ